MTSPYQAEGANAQAPFTLKVHRGESMVLIAMNWRSGKPPAAFVGWFISCKSPRSATFKPLSNRLGFSYDPNQPSNPWTSTEVSPIQKFRWVHFPADAEGAGSFTYRVVPVFMDDNDNLTYGEKQEASIDLGLETYVDELNVAFTRGFVSSQAFIDRYLKDGHTLHEIMPDSADNGLNFKATHPHAKAALEWMGFEARDAILKLLDAAIADPAAKVDAIVYDFNLPDIADKLEKLAPRLRLIVDDSKSVEKGVDKGHDRPDSPESTVAARLEAAGAQVKRQHMASLQHNKTIVVRDGSSPMALCGSTNFSWRGFFIQANNAVILKGRQAAEVFAEAFQSYWDAAAAKDFRASPSATQPWKDLGLPNSKAAVTFCPHNAKNAVLDDLAEYISTNTTSSLLFALAFLYESTGSLRAAITGLESKPGVFVYGMSDQEVSGIDMKMADGHMAVVYPDYLTDADTPADFKAELSSLPGNGKRGTRLHHKFIVTDFNTPAARVYMGSFNFSGTADTSNGENLLVFEDPRVATAYMVEALRLFDHYEWRIKRHGATDKNTPLLLRKPPRKAGEKAWWQEDWTDKRKAADRLLFS
jgi:hypothetical protein